MRGRLVNRWVIELLRQWWYETPLPCVEDEAEFNSADGPLTES